MAFASLDLSPASAVPVVLPISHERRVLVTVFGGGVFAVFGSSSAAVEAGDRRHCFVVPGGAVGVPFLLAPNQILYGSGLGGIAFVTIADEDALFDEDEGA